ncbi:glycine cleavage system protein GcvH [Komagataeibacter medellinensis]|uniref:Glycine cleavage system H protein n=2 Tax=Komagataeibacter medellinensis TaxID=1177712 RepID=G2I1S7_KOMMN|nr:glycine cleavage system protein GcvH [Komagataeibacter medellinensis]KAB8123538.1 glycine cleavage system protein GcvH [Komagataeibacter medellinensis]BAK84863.1 glycine cleavage system H protein [Komagataeibacter medellinensis NBRC 3288]
MTVYYTKEHEWLRVEGNVAVVGITAHAAGELGELVFAEARDPGTTVEQGDSVAVVESVKAASDIYAPVTGDVLAFNDALTDDAALVNRDPEGEGWIVRMTVADASQLEGLLDHATYTALVG